MVKRNKAFRYRIYPSSEQETLFSKTFGCCRFLYNAMLSDRIEEYRKTGKMLRNTPAAYKKVYGWLKEVDSLALANVQLHLEKAYRNFFSRKGAGFPKFKSKHHSRASYTTNLVNGNIVLNEKGLRLPKAGIVKIRRHREIPEGYRIKSVTVSREPSGKFYASILCEYGISENQADPAAGEDLRYLGMDYAMHGLAVLSDGTDLAYPSYYRKSSEKLAREQRKLSRCERGSRNYRKQRKRVALCHEKIRNQRRDFHHKASRKLADSYDVIVTEDLNIKAMSQGLKLGKGVMDNGYGMLLEMLGYKLEEQGKILLRIGRFFPSSKKCSRCGRVKEELPLSERVYHCGCGMVMDRDLNAAINIREEGKRILAAS